MSLLCLVGRHRPRPHVVRNQGFTFGRCSGCERDLVRSMGRWQTVPRGFRIVWRSAGAEAAPPTMPVPSASAVPAETALSRISMVAALAGAGLRALMWGIGDRLARPSVGLRFLRRPALLRLPAQ